MKLILNKNTKHFYFLIQFGLPAWAEEKHKKNRSTSILSVSWNDLKLKTNWYVIISVSSYHKINFDSKQH